MSQGGRLVGKVEEVAYHDVHKDTKVVGVEIFISCGGGEE